AAGADFCPGLLVPAWPCRYHQDFGRLVQSPFGQEPESAELDAEGRAGMAVADAHRAAPAGLALSDDQSPRHLCHFEVLEVNAGSPAAMAASIDADIAIVGAGLSGTLAAIVLGRAGYDVVLIDRNA